MKVHIMAQSRTSILLPLLSLMLILSLMLTTGCGWFGGTKKIVIEEALSALESRRSEMIALNKSIQKADFYADESGEGIVIEYTFSKAAVLKESFTDDSAKLELIAKFKDNEGIKSILEHDVFVRFLFKSADGKVVADSKLEKKDL